MSESFSHPDGFEPSVSDTAEDGYRQLVLVKRGQRYVFRYQPGEESKVLLGLVEMVREGNSDLDWFDAAVLSHQIGQRISQSMHKYLKP